MTPQPFALLGATPPIKKILGSAVALSATAKIVADCGTVDKQDYLRLTNYETRAEIARHPLPIHAHTLEFSADGKHLLVIPGGKGTWSRVLVYAEPWTSPPIVDIENRLHSIYHGVWIDPRTIVIAGTVAYGQLCIAVLTLDGRLRIVHDEVVPEGRHALDNKIDTGACSSTGRVVFGTGYGRNLLMYQLADDRMSAIAEGPVAGRRTGNSYEMAIDDKTGSILCGHKEGLTLFDAKGREVCALDSTYSRPEPINCRSGIVVFRVYTARGVAEVRAYLIRPDSLELWCTYDAEGHARGCDVLVDRDRTLLAVEESDHTRVLLLMDADVLQLDAEDPEQRLAAVMSVRLRRYLPARDALIRRVDDENEQETIRDAAVRTLADMRDALTIPSLIRSLGSHPSAALADSLQLALRRFDPDEMIRAAIECAQRPSLKYRRGALLLLETLPEGFDVVDTLAWALSDNDKEVRLIAARALGRRAAIGAVPALLGGLDDPEPRVRLAVQQAITDILLGIGVWDVPDPILSEPLDMAAFARELISSGQMTDFTARNASSASKLLGRLALACAKLQTLDVLNAIEALTDPPEIALAVAVVMGDAMRSVERWAAAISMYRRATDLASSAQAPAIEWRALHATAECLTAMHDDRSAWDCYQQAMKVIDRLWFALLEEHKLQRFFHEKARLYDGAALCALKLGYGALALECSEKSKTRYLGDLIARRQRDPERVLQPELREFWRNTDTLRNVRVTSGAAASGGEEAEIVAVGHQEDANDVAPNQTVLVPKHLARFEEHWATLRGEQHERLSLVRRVWFSVATFQADENLRERASVLYDVIDDLRRLIESDLSGFSGSPHADVLANFDTALSDLLALGEKAPSFAGVVLSGDEAPYWISQLLDPATRVESTLLLEAMQEALDTVLHRRPVVGVRTQRAGSAMGISFATRQRHGESKAAQGRTSVIQTSLQRFAETRWRYTMMLARGDTIGFREVAESVAGQADLAHLQFTVTNEGTVAHVIRGRPSQQQAPGRALHPAYDFETFLLPSVDDTALRRLLIGGEDSWFAKYQARRGKRGRSGWLKAIDDTLRGLHGKLIAPIESAFEAPAVRRLQVVPHRGLHLMPFAGMYQKQGRADRRYLIDDYEIAYSPSATLHHICRERAADKTARRSLTAVVNPTEDLPFSPFEIEGFADLFAKNDRRILRAKQASAKELRGLVTNCFFHFAGHAYYAWDKPLDSALLLANEHALTVGTLFDEGLPLHETLLVVLSACETNVTDAHDLADEYIGLAAAFMFAGAPAVVCTLWAVDDVATMLLMGKFYHLLLTPSEASTCYLRPAAALRSAQLWLRDVTAQSVIDELGQNRLRNIWDAVAKGRVPVAPLGLLGEIMGKTIAPDDRIFQHPYYWAAFILVGDHAPLEMPRSGG